VSEKVLKEAVTLCLDNAEQYIKDAEALVKISSYGHAFALAVLAEEELAKAYVCYIHAESGLEIKGRWRRSLTEHRAKQAIQAGFAFWYKLASTMLDIIDSVRREVEQGDISENQAKDRLWRRMAEYPKRMEEEGSPESIEWDEYLKWFKTMREDKERGLYVDIDFKRGRLSSPRSLTIDEVKKYLSQIKERFEITKFIVNQPLSPSDKIRLKETLKSLKDELIA